MVDLFMEAGFTYFDTAYVYPGSEAAIRKALVERYPRESYTLATKLNAAMLAPNEKAARRQLDVSLERTGAGYIDYYLLHALNEGNYRKYDKFHIWDFVKEQQAAGRIKKYGFSFHGGPELLEELLTLHPDVDFVQLQINYADWENPRIQSRANYEVARAHGKAVVIMEPVKGGALANPPEAVKKRMKEVNPDASYASWAIRFAAGLEGVRVVLSGMSNLEQMRDNLSYMSGFQPLNEEELAVLAEAQHSLGSSRTIPCTACSYCIVECPKQIPIPDIFQAFNVALVGGKEEDAAAAYEKAVEGKSSASACIRCGKCEAACPQHLPIRKHLADAAEAFGR